jgi:hypothetical protein
LSYGVTGIDIHTSNGRPSSAPTSPPRYPDAKQPSPSAVLFHTEDATPTKPPTSRDHNGWLFRACGEVDARRAMPPSS